MAVMRLQRADAIRIQADVAQRPGKVGLAAEPARLRRRATRESARG